MRRFSFEFYEITSIRTPPKKMFETAGQENRGEKKTDNEKGKKTQKKAKLPFSNMAERKAVIKNADMSEDMQQDAVDCASQALEKYNIEKVLRCFLV